MVPTLIPVFPGSVVILKVVWVGHGVVKNLVQILPTVLKLVTELSRMAALVMLVTAVLVVLRMPPMPARSRWAREVTLLLVNLLAVGLIGSRLEIRT